MLWINAHFVVYPTVQHSNIGVGCQFQERQWTVILEVLAVVGFEIRKCRFVVAGRFDAVGELLLAENAVRKSVLCKIKVGNQIYCFICNFRWSPKAPIIPNDIIIHRYSQEKNGIIFCKCFCFVLLTVNNSETVATRRDEDEAVWLNIGWYFYVL